MDLKNAGQVLKLCRNDKSSYNEDVYLTPRQVIEMNKSREQKKHEAYQRRIKASGLDWDLDTEMNRASARLAKKRLSGESYFKIRCKELSIKPALPR